LIVLLAVANGGCERDFSFLDDRGPVDASDDGGDRPDVVPDHSAPPFDAGFDVSAARDVLAPIDSNADSNADSIADASGAEAPVVSDALDAGGGRIAVHLIALRGNHMCLIEPTSGAVLCRGDEQDGGQLLDSSTNEWHAVTVSLDGAKLAGARTIAAGTSFACAIASGDVMCWGTLPGTSEYSAIAKTLIPGNGLRIENLQAGEGHVCVSTPAYCWGDNTYSQITNIDELDAADIREPRLMPDLEYETLVTLGFRHTCAQDGDRTLCWGLDDFRQCGNKPDRQCLPDAPCATQPIEVSGVTAALGLGLGVSHTCAIKADRTVTCWGASDKGQSGTFCDFSAEACIVDPFDVPNVRDASRLALGAAHSCAVTTDGFVYCWGSNESGQLGITSIGGIAPDARQVLTTDMSPLRDVVDIAASDSFTCAVTSSGKLACWGTWRNDPVLTTATEIPVL
jgi:alpha-tubulin suppressor-like RCC1 family protein